MTASFTIPTEAKLEDGFIEDEDYRDSYMSVLDNPDKYKQIKQTNKTNKTNTYKQ